MSSAYCYFIYGCRVPPDDLLEPEALAKMIEVCEDSPLAPDEIGFHSTYHGGDDFFWFGQAYDDADEGFRTTPDPLPRHVKVAVTDEWEKLPDVERHLLGRPELLLLVGID